MGHALRTTGIVFLFLVFPAYGYIDPGSGTMIFQLLFTMFLGSVFYFRNAIRAVVKWISKRISN